MFQDGVRPVFDLLAQTSTLQIATDALVICHLVALVAGLGTVLRTDLSILMGLKRAFTAEDLEMVHRAHRTIGVALFALWVTGFGLAWVKTGGALGQASPKLVAKLITVSCLTGTALAMSVAGLRILQSAVGAPLVALATRRRLLLGFLAGMSVAGWGTALLLGAAGTTRPADWAALSVILNATHFGAVGLMVTAAWLSPRLLLQRDLAEAQKTEQAWEEDRLWAVTTQVASRRLEEKQAA